MSKKQQFPKHPQTVKPQPPTRNKLVLFFLRICIFVGTACAISAAIYAFFNIYKPKNAMELTLFVFAGFCIYVYGVFDTRDKMKKWGLTNCSARN